MKFWKRAAAVMVAITLCVGIPAYFPAQLTTPLSVQAADVDADNSITIADAYTILLYYAEHTAGNPISWEELLHN